MSLRWSLRSRTAVAERPGGLAPVVVLALVLLLVLPGPTLGQAPGYSPGGWKQVGTEHFLFIFPDELSDWALSMAERMEAVHGAVAALVGFAPEDRVTVLVDDPSNVSNGSMNPGPLLYMWPTPPGPRSVIGENRGWGEILAVHEFAHAAHLTRPSRNPADRLRWALAPVPVQPIMFRTPRWAIEGYATYVEGRLTGSGRPHGVWRPAILRTWALEGQLPRYRELNFSQEFLGPSMAYLMGSAFFEWLVEREDGDVVVLPNVWRRLTARQRRNFDGAFSGVFGHPPAELYGRFTVEVMERALAVRAAVDAAGGVVDGELFQRFTWLTGDPAVSPDGEHVALVLRSRRAPPRLVVLSTTPDTMTTKARERYAKVFEADPEDVEPVQRVPRAQRPLATLHPAVGRPYDAPAFMPDGKGILVVRSDLIRNERSRPDLFLWDWEEGGVRRITRGEAIRQASPAPDGAWAAGLRCLRSYCDIVRIDLATGAVTTLARGDLLRPYDRPRVSPDGRTIVASAQVDGAWRLVAMDADGGRERLIGPDDGAARFDAVFLPDGRSLVVTSTRGGIHDLELLDLETGDVRPLTRVLGAAVAPAPAPGGDVFFLSLHSRGWDLRRVNIDAPPAAPVVFADAGLSPAAPVFPQPVDTFPPSQIGPVSAYRPGTRSGGLIPMIDAGVDGTAGGLTWGGTDPIGRLGWQIQGMYGDPGASRGASLRVVWRGVRPWLHLHGFLDDLRDRRHRGGAGFLELRHARLAHAHSLRIGGSAGELDPGGTRILGFGDYDLRLHQSRGALRLGQRGAFHAAIGRTGELEWNRWLATGSLEARVRDRGLVASGTAGATDAPAGSFERFSVGGTDPLLVDPVLLSQQVAMPALPAGQLRGDAVRTLRVDLHGLPLVAPFYWAGNVDGDALGWYRVAGVEAAVETASIPHSRIPGLRFRAGVARTLTDPDADQWRAWMLLGYRP